MVNGRWSIGEEQQAINVVFLIKINWLQKVFLIKHRCVIANSGRDFCVLPRVSPVLFQRYGTKKYKGKFKQH